MQYIHREHSPRIDPTAVIAPGAVIAGDVTIGAHCLVGFGAILLAEGSPIVLSEYVIVREQALIRATAAHPVHIGRNVLIGPQARLHGCTVGEEAFLATGATIFHGASIGKGAEIRVNGVVHVTTTLPAGALVPIGWVAVGNPASILPPSKHDEIWARQEPLNFPKVVYDLDRRPDGSVDMRALTKRVYDAGYPHRHDQPARDARAI
jgi:carbonic anhydrase/acetyltransferase-like protein (isoleucine patch superfamily)